VPGVGEFIAEHCHAHDWDDQAARDVLVSALVSDALTIINACGDATLDEPAGQALALLALVAGQDVEPAEILTAPTDGGASPAGSLQIG